MKGKNQNQRAWGGGKNGQTVVQSAKEKKNLNRAARGRTPPVIAERGGCTRKRKNRDRASGTESAIRREGSLEGITRRSRRRATKVHEQLVMGKAREGGKIGSRNTRRYSTKRGAERLKR